MIPKISKIQGSKELPLELNLLIESLEKVMGQEKILPTIMNIDSYAQNLSKEDIFLVGKVEIYKTLLKSNEKFPKAVINGNSTERLKDTIKKENDPFTKWFLVALLQDCESLMSTANYKDYMLQKAQGLLERIELKKIDKKVHLLYRWISKLSPDSSDIQEAFKSELASAMQDSLFNIEESFYLMATSSISGNTPKLINSPSELKFFTIKEIKTEKKTPKTGKGNKTLTDIFDSITDEANPKAANLPEPSGEDWLNDENAPTNLKNLPKPSNDADWLQDF